MRDDDFRELCVGTLVNSNSNQIYECRVMREKKGADKKGHAILGKSKGFGFVEFSTHEQALNCLKKLNNIVEFSIENLSALRLREKRNIKKDDESVEEERPKKKAKLDLSEQNTRAVQATKTALAKGGQKWMPKKLGVKERHREAKKRASKNNKRAERRMKNPKYAAKKANKKGKK